MRAGTEAVVLKPLGTTRNQEELKTSLWARDEPGAV